MASTYSTNNGIELIGDGEQSGTWGDTTNVNWELVDEALEGQLVKTLSSAGTSGSPNTLTITDGATAEGRHRFIEFTDGSDLGTTAYAQLVPNDAEKIFFVKNSLSGSRSLILFQGTYSASNDYELANGDVCIVRFDGGGAGAVCSLIGRFTTSSEQSALQTYAANAPTAAELQQVQNIDTSTISTAQWGYLGATTAFGATLMDDADQATAQATLGVVPGTDVQAYSADLDTYASNPLTAVELQQLQNIGASTISAAQWGYLGATSAYGASLMDDADAGTARTTLGLGSIATQDASSVTITGGSITGITDVAVADGGTGASTAANALVNLGGISLRDFAALSPPTNGALPFWDLSGTTWTYYVPSTIGYTLMSAASEAAGRTAIDALGASGDTLGGGYTASSVSDGTQSSGTYTPSPSGGNFRAITNGGAFTLAAPTASGVYTMVIDITNNGTAGAITFSGFAKVIGDGDLTTTDTENFQLMIVKTTSGVTANVVAMQ